MKPVPKAKLILPIVKRYGLALAVAAITISINVLLLHFSIRISLTLLVIAALIISARYGGKGPGLMIAVIFEAVSTLSNPIPPGVSTGSYIFGRISNFLLMASIVLLVSSRQHAEKNLRLSLEELANMKFALDESSIVAITDQKGIITFVNDKFCEISGYSREELIGQDHRIINSKYHSKEFIRNLWKTIANGKVWKGEIKNRRKDGSYYWVDTTIVPFLNKQGKPYQYIAIRNDITERKLTETALSQKVLLIEQSYEPIFVWDSERGIVNWNRGSERLYGYTRKEALGKISYELLQAVYPVPIDEYLSELKKNEFWAGEVRHRTKDGREVIVESRQQMLELDGHSIVLVTNRDITERRRAQEELRKSEERYRALASSAQMVWIADAEGHLSNPAENWTRITGLSLEDSKNYWWLSGVHPDDREFTLEKWKEAIESKQVYEVENRILMADGNYRYYYSRGVPVFNEDGSVREWVGMSVDINERKEAENAIQQLNETLEQRVAERTIELEAVNKELEAFSYSVSHDLRAPLRAIDGFSRALLEDYADKLDEEGQVYLNRVRAGSQNMARLIEDLLNLSRVTRSEIRREKVNLSAIVREIAERLRESQPERDVVFDIEENIMVNGDEHLLCVAMENLLSNAWKFTSKREKAEISFGQCFKNEKSEYFIRDNGAGFDMTYADKLFGAFQRLHSAKDFEGTGVGLATVQRIIRRHGGQIRAESRVDEGTVFYFTL